MREHGMGNGEIWIIQEAKRCVQWKITSMSEDKMINFGREISIRVNPNHSATSGFLWQFLWSTLAKRKPLKPTTLSLFVCSQLFSQGPPYSWLATEMVAILLSKTQGNSQWHTAFPKIQAGTQTRRLKLHLTCACVCGPPQIDIILWARRLWYKSCEAHSISLSYMFMRGPNQPRSTESQVLSSVIRRLIRLCTDVKFDFYLVWPRAYKQSFSLTSTLVPVGFAQTTATWSISFDHNFMWWFS